jgi:hypothetical protein
MVLSDLHSIISVPSPDKQNSPLLLFHASFGDFLTDRLRCGDTFFLDSGTCHRNIANRIVRQFMNPASGSHLIFLLFSEFIILIIVCDSSCAFPEGTPPGGIRGTMHESDPKFRIPFESL